MKSEFEIWNAERERIAQRQSVSPAERATVLAVQAVGVGAFLVIALCGLLLGT